MKVRCESVQNTFLVKPTLLFERDWRDTRDWRQGETAEGSKFVILETSIPERHTLAHAHLARPAYPLRRTSHACLTRLSCTVVFLMREAL